MTIGKQLNGGPTDWIVRTILAALFVWGLSQLSGMREEMIQLRENLAGVQETRFTDSDGRDLAIELSTVRGALGTKADSSDVPPPEVIRWLERIERRIDRLEALHRRPAEE